MVLAFNDAALCNVLTIIIIEFQVALVLKFALTQISKNHLQGPSLLTFNLYNQTIIYVIITARSELK